MNKELELWQFIAGRLSSDEHVMLLVVATSSGSSPGRAGYKMAVGRDGELMGSIGGGVMEVRLVEQAKAMLSESRPVGIAGGLTPGLIEQVHQKNAPNASGMICSGKQTVVYKLLTAENAETVGAIVELRANETPSRLTIDPKRFFIERLTPGAKNDTRTFETRGDGEFIYQERLGYENELFIVGGGHCALALSELMSRMDFRISIFDDRPGLNTIEKNRFANSITIIDGYDRVGELIPAGDNVYVVVMTLGYKSDETVIRGLFGKDLRYFGVLGSKAKMKTIMNALIEEGFSADKLSQIRTPIGMPIKSHTPEEIAVSIAAEIIMVKNK